MGARRLANAMACAGAITLTTLAAQASAQSIEDLQHMSIDELANVDVTSASKTAQPLSDAPTAIYVITHDDIVRSGATSIPEILRLAPNLQVYQTSASNYVVTARGFSGNNTAQAFSDKLLVLIDGRSVYTPLFSGVYWDMQTVPPEDIERIEVISGPGATLWGANAVNGVVNIITRKSADTQGGFVEIGGGNQQANALIQYGGRVGADLTYRVYAQESWTNDTQTATGASAGDHWNKPQGGLRLDWTPTNVDDVLFEGDDYSGDEAQAGGDEIIAGGDVLGRWNHAFADGSALQLQTYFDHVERATVGGGQFVVNTYDADLQHSFNLGDRNAIVWGGGLRLVQYRIDGTPSLFFVPPARTLDLSNGFVQDSISITPATTLVLGVKVEDDPYSGVSALPSARLALKPTDTSLIWAAVSRAIRSPTPFDTDVVEKIGAMTGLTGTSDFLPEKLTAYEVGARLQPAPRLSFSVSAFYNVYDDLRTIEPASPGGFFPLHWGNLMKGDTYGVEAWGDYRLTPWWRVSASYDWLHEDLSFAPGASQILGVAQAGDDPSQQASLRSSMNLGPKVTLDADLRYVGALPNPYVPAYAEMNARVAWNVTDRVQLSLSGFNLLHDRHQEFPAPATAIPRSFYADIRWRF